MMLTVTFLNGIVLNLAAILLLLLAWKQPRVTKLLFSILFAVSAIANLLILLAGIMGKGTGSMAMQGNSWAGMSGSVDWRFIALIIWQLAIAIALLLRGWVYITAVISAIILLGTIIPLGTAAAFPSTFIMALALTRLLRFNHHYFWYVPSRIWT